MRQNLTGTFWRVSIFMVVCFFGIFALVAVFGELRFTSATAYNAVFTNVSGLKGGNFVRIAGVEVGKVRTITVNDDATVNVEFSTDKSVVLTEGTRAVIKYENLVSDRYLALEEGPGHVKTLRPGQIIPVSRTQPALDFNALIGGFRPLFRALDPQQVNALTGQLIAVFQGEGVTIGDFLSQTASLTSTLADRDQLIGQVIGNLNTVLGSFGDQNKQFDKAVDSLSELMKGLAERKSDISNGVAYMNAVAGSVTDLLSQARPPLQNTVHQLDRVAGIVAADHEYLDHLLETLPDKYQVLGRQGLYGDFFSFYLCDVVLKVNGKGGQPVYIKVAGQATGRCTPK
ncbi:virulence factor Mce family protein [Mycobacterium paraseoulense]|uniref:Mammalian cell entry protein n=1 Tax=Mycobacterium paraseoulense TaxID=590652 RepID=A0A1X0I818_9MYCO|nr:virulence factor Mce family protein [Mycobacterium paraseoulense]MCV7393948.1 virulence factor Mce family protein [Mycobacterium paraseoulense]ORB38385.1 mammalian cell entry protein [Mycobacterium paraseoulense]BBZ70423.1 Mce family protein Mce3B [Mycobacterium paraseoulense]